MSDKTVGIVGVGLMGHGIALNILRKGWTLRFLEHPGNQPVEDLVALGGAGVADRQDLARDSDIILLCVNGTPQVEEVLLGPDGMLAALRPGMIVIDCSTAIPSSTERLAEKAMAAGARFLDAPMTRTPLEAAQGRLNLLIGGDSDTYEAALPLLECFSENRFYAGPAGSGHKLKLLHNFVSLGFATLLGEAAACAAEGGIAPDVLVDVLTKGGGYGAALDRVGPYILDRDPSKMKFSVANAHKDLSYYTAMARDLGCARSTAEGALGALEALMNAGRQASFIVEGPTLFRETKPE